MRVGVREMLRSACACTYVVVACARVHTCAEVVVHSGYIICVCELIGRK